MPLNSLDVMMAIKNGLSLACATCDHYWTAKDNGSSDCGQVCGGPMAGGVFDKYRGPITDFSGVCFICGEKPTHIIQARGNVRTLGCCNEHVSYVKSFVPVNREPVNVTLKNKDGEVSSEELAARPQRMRLKLL